MPDSLADTFKAMPAKAQTYDFKRTGKNQLVMPGFLPVSIIIEYPDTKTS